jgi:hypothetical protein
LKGGFLAKLVMPGLVPGIHVLVGKETWMAGTKPGHDERIIAVILTG